MSDRGRSCSSRSVTVDFSTRMRASRGPRRSRKGFTTIKIRRELRQWIKMLAASRGVTMYQLLEDLIAKSREGRHRPWDDDEENKG